MYAPHTVTVFHVGDTDPATLKKGISSTVLRGVLLDASKGVNVRESGLVGADAVTMFIPFSVDAYDAMTGAPRAYADPKVYSDAADKSGLWTMAADDDFFAKGEIMQEADFQTINARYDDVYRITKVDKKDFGSASMQHWEVGGS